MKRKNDEIFVTQPSLPPLEDLIPYLELIWESKKVTNNGPLHERLEKELCAYLKVPYISLFSNATIALITALKALEVEGEVITTPFSFVATAHAILWNGIKPVFTDIDPFTLNLDPNKIAAAITPRTTAIMPVHVYGHPCDVDAINRIATEYNLKVIYDAAHAFGVKCHCGSVLNHGDLSVLSFHATKVFNTFEGGAVICKDEGMKRRIDQLKNFGFINEVTVCQTGINGKMSEFNAALGLAQLRHVDAAIERRGAIDAAYRNALCGVSGIRCHSVNSNVSVNFGYFPIFVDEGYHLTRDELYFKLRAHGINGRRYFYPLITDFPMYRGMQNPESDPLVAAKRASECVICLPIYPSLDLNSLERVTRIIRG